MTRRPPLYGRRLLATERKPIGARYGIRGPVIVLALIVVFGGGVVADHYDSANRAAHVRSALAAHGLGPAQVERDWPPTFRCKHAYRWRTARANGSACTNSFSGAVTLFDGDRRPLATP